MQNAATFTQRDGRVTVRVWSDGERAGILVRDTGVGMEPELCASAFGAFVQGDRTLARCDGGLGLELALVKGPKPPDPAAIEALLA